MLSVPLFKEDIKESRKNWLFCTGFLCLLFLIHLGLYSPLVGTRFESLFSYIPEWILRLLGLLPEDPSLTGFVGGLYRFWYVLVPCVYTARMARKLVARQENTGTLVYYVGTPLGREKVIFTQGYFLGFSLFFMIAVSAAFGMIASELLLPEELEIPQFLLMNLGIFCVHFFVGSLGFLGSSMGNGSIGCLALGIGLPVLWLLAAALGNLKGAFGVFRFFTPYSLTTPDRAIQGDVLLFLFLPLLLALGGGAYWLAIWVFKRRDLTMGQVKKVFSKHRKQ